jgi:hypothetical protein
MLRSPAFLYYFDLPKKLVELAGQIEFSMREKRFFLDYGIISEILNHLYNTLLMESFLPFGKQRLFELINEVEDCLENNDLENVKLNLEDLKTELDGFAKPPDID